MRFLKMYSAGWLCAVLSAACGDTSIADFVIADPAPDLAGSADLARTPPDAAEPVEFQPPVSCGAVLPGPPLKSGVTEAQPGYAEDLATVDLSMVPDPLDYSTNTQLAITVINYMLGRSQGTSISHEEALKKGGMGRAVLAAAAKGTGGRVDLPMLRRGLYYFYPCSRPVPGNLMELRSRYGDYRTWPGQELDCSRPKNGPRRLHEDYKLGVYVAETVLNGSVRETEVLFTSLRKDGQIDFAAYTADGALSDRSTFAAGGGSDSTLAAPYTCISCHVDTTNWLISRLTPTGTGAGCR